MFERTDTDHQSESSLGEDYSFFKDYDDGVEGDAAAEDKKDSKSPVPPLNMQANDYKVDRDEKL